MWFSIEIKSLSLDVCRCCTTTTFTSVSLTRPRWRRIWCYRESHQVTMHQSSTCLLAHAYCIWTTGHDTTTSYENKMENDDVELVDPNHEVEHVDIWRPCRRLLRSVVVNWCGESEWNIRAGQGWLDPQTTGLLQTARLQGLSLYVSFMFINYIRATL